MRKNNKNTSSGLKPRSMINKETTVTLKPSRKSRTKTRKPKFLSLRLELISPENTQHSDEMPPTTTATDHHHQLNLFPLHPENLVEDKDTSDENVAYFFSTADGGATTLTGLLGAETSSSSDEDNNNNNTTLSPSSLTYAYRGQVREEGAQLVRNAMRNKEREPSEEKWVSYSEVTSCSPDLPYKNETHRLSLKLDYQEIMNAWSDKGPLYIHMDSPQVVPHLHDDDFLSHASTTMGWGTNGGLWRVPEMSGCNSNGCVKVEEVQGGGEEWKTGQREASVLRYKEKRQNRLFSKKIRYEVRKLNAEKRPRIKGRFVKRN